MKFQLTIKVLVQKWSLNANWAEILKKKNLCLGSKQKSYFERKFCNEVKTYIYIFFLQEMTILPQNSMVLVSYQKDAAKDVCPYLNILNIRMESDHVWLFYLPLPHFIWNILPWLFLERQSRGVEKWRGTKSQACDNVLIQLLSLLLLTIQLLSLKKPDESGCSNIDGLEWGNDDYYTFYEGEPTATSCPNDEMWPKYTGIIRKILDKDEPVQIDE